jgi:hypothetical protein
VRPQLPLLPPTALTHARPLVLVGIKDSQAAGVFLAATRWGPLPVLVSSWIPVSNLTFLRGRTVLAREAEAQFLL